MVGNVFAFGDNTNQQQQGQIGINRNDNDVDNRNANINDVDNRNTNRNNNLNRQGQGQVSVGQANPNYNSEVKTEAYSFAPPALSSNRGMNEGNIYSIFGGIGLSEDSEYTVCIEKLATVERMEKLGYLTKEQAQTEAASALLQLKDATKPKRILCFGPKTRGRHLLNGFGLLAWDSWVNEDKVNQRIMKKESK